MIIVRSLALNTILLYEEHDRLLQINKKNSRPIFGNVVMFGDFSIVLPIFVCI